MPGPSLSLFLCAKLWTKIKMKKNLDPVFQMGGGNKNMLRYGTRKLFAPLPRIKKQENFHLKKHLVFFDANKISSFIAWIPFFILSV